MQGKRVLFYDTDDAAAQTAKRALLATGCEATVVQQQDALSVEELARHDLGILTVDGTDDALLLELLDRAAELYPRTRLLLHVGERSERCIEWMLDRPHLGNIIAKRDVPVDSDELVVTTAKLLWGDIFGLEKYLLWGVKPYQLRVQDSRDKVQYVREVSSLATRLGCSSRVVELVETVVDELSTNAIFNAPRDAEGRPRYAHLNRREAVALDSDEEGELTYAFDGNYFVIAQRDPFGSLARDTVVTYLDRCLKQTPDQQPGAGGAGMGLFRVYRALSKLIINIRPGELTEVIGLIDLRQSIKRFKQQPKSVHFFVEEAQV